MNDTYYSDILFAFNFAVCCATNGDIGMQFIDEFIEFPFIDIYIIIKKMHYDIHSRFDTNFTNILESCSNYQIVKLNDRQLPQKVVDDLEENHVTTFMLNNSILIDIGNVFKTIYVNLNIKYIKDLFHYKNNKLIKKLKLQTMSNIDIKGIYKLLILIDHRSHYSKVEFSARLGGKAKKHKYDMFFNKRLNHIKSEIQDNNYINGIYDELKNATTSNNTKLIRLHIIKLINDLVIIDYDYCLKNNIKGYNLTLEELKNNYTSPKRNILNLTDTAMGKKIKINLKYWLEFSQNTEQ